MKNLNITFDLKNLVGHISYDNEFKKENINIFKINNFTYMASMSLIFDKNFKWVFTWEVWANHEQFVDFLQYNKMLLIDSNIKNGWQTLAKWSYISKPSKGTVQTNNVYQMTYKENKLSNINVNFSVIGSPYGDFNSNKFIKGYYY